MDVSASLDELTDQAILRRLYCQVRRVHYLLEESMSELTDKIDRLSAAWEADEANDAAVLAEVIRVRDAAVADRDAALADDATDKARIAELEADAAAAAAKLDELLAKYPTPVEENPAPVEETPTPVDEDTPAPVEETQEF